MIKSRIGKFIVSAIAFCEDVAKIIIKTKWKIGAVPELENKEVVVIGNGPSFGEFLKTSEGFLHGKELFCVNHFANTEAFERIKPQHYVLLDGYFFEEHDGKNPAIYKAICEKLCWEMTLYVPVACRNYSPLNELLKDIPELSVVHFNYVVLNSSNSLVDHLLRKGRAMIQCQTVLVSAIFLAVQSKCSKVFIIGADHTFHRQIHVGKDNKIYYTNSHFYENKEKVSLAGDSRNGLNLTMFRFYENMSMVYKGYERLKNFSVKQGVDIINITPNSFVDVFDRVTITNKEQV